jgi:hypothetical protein
MAQVCISRIAIATPPNEVHATFIEYAATSLHDSHCGLLLRHLAKRSGIDVSRPRHEQ